MEQYIPKSAIVAQTNIEITGCRLAAQQGILTEFGKGKLEGLEGLVDFINTLEVKEVELSYEDYMRFFTEHPDFPDDWGFDEAWIFAKHFFELGLKAAQKGEVV